MKKSAPRAPRGESSWSDTKLVRECLRGDEDAWAALVDKYKNRIFSIPIKRGFSQENAAEVFQRVRLLLLAELHSLREPKALPMWLIRVTANECSRWLRQERPHLTEEPIEAELGIADESRDRLDEMIAQIGKEQRLREALLTQSPRCRNLIHMLFFEPEPRPYRDVASSLGLATGSIGFMRSRCLEHLRRRLSRWSSDRVMNA